MSAYTTCGGFRISGFNVLHMFWANMRVAYDAAQLYQTPIDNFLAEKVYDGANLVWDDVRKYWTVGPGGAGATGPTGPAGPTSIVDLSAHYLPCDMSEEQNLWEDYYAVATTEQGVLISGKTGQCNPANIYGVYLFNCIEGTGPPYNAQIIQALNLGGPTGTTYRCNFPWKNAFFPGPPPQQAQWLNSDNAVYAFIDCKNISQLRPIHFRIYFRTVQGEIDNFNCDFCVTQEWIDFWKTQSPAGMIQVFTDLGLYDAGMSPPWIGGITGPDPATCVPLLVTSNNTTKYNKI